MLKESKGVETKRARPRFSKEKNGGVKGLARKTMKKIIWSRGRNRGGGGEIRQWGFEGVQR